MKIALLSNPNKDGGYECSKKVAEYLFDKNFEIYSDTSEILDNIPVFSLENCVSYCDMVIAVGGDGTILHVAAAAAEKNKPLLGINLGKIRYMAENEPDEIELLEKLIDKDFITEKRMMLNLSVIRNSETVFSSNALNDVVISRGRVPKLSEISLCEGEKKICDYSADGIIFSTPTGSTAYTLSAGGPIIDPELDCIIATPICAHTLSRSRSIVFRPEADIRAMLLSDNEACLTADGGNEFILHKGDTVSVKKSRIFLTLIKLKNRSFYEKLSYKLK